MKTSDEINRLHQLYKDGALTEDEFVKAKERVFQQAATSESSSGPDVIEAVNRFRRSVNDCWLGGVCGGLARSTGVDSWVWRLICVFLCISAGMGIIVYLLAWILIPEE